ncbi:amidase domain-containing protein [Streptomyces sp. Qhu-G9]|uniref:amidase domain-containing protein n=1 Tax=Streptomyces sp. Qhu-G9 TaxID=3452799 RepID=UPI0022ABF8B9|nr:amidase domain-containing protein [Streptomyces aurantiacus]WAU86181.1 amidase domain-containing protein [Streptomyces aurantiacus]
MRACTDLGCSAWSYEQEFTARAAADPAAPQTRSLVLTGAALDDATVPVGGKACPEGGACPAVRDTKLTLGGADGERVAWLRPDLTKLPAGARIAKARLVLSPAQPGPQRPVEVYELLDPWTTAQKGGELLTALDEAPFADAAPLADQDLAPVVQSWLEQESGEGLAVRLPAAERTTGAAYHSARAADTALRPKLEIEYVAPTAPAAPQNVRVTPGDAGLLATWNAPKDNGSAGDGPQYTAVVTKADGTEAARTTGAEPRAVVSGLANGTAYRVTVTARTAHGTSPAVGAEPVTTAAVPAGSAAYREIVRQYLDARAGLVTGRHTTVAAALAASPHAASFQDLLRAQAPGLIESRAALARHGSTYTDATATLSDVLVGTDDSGTVFLRAAVDEKAVLRQGPDDTTGETDEGSQEQRFTFSTNGGAPILHLEADAPAAETVLTESASTWQGLDVAPPEGQDADEVPDEPIALDADGFPVEEPTTVRQASALRANVSGSGTAKWASKNIKTKWEYGLDCTNFVSKALYYGGKMKTRMGGRKHDRAWWQQYYLFGSIKNKSYTWSGAENFRRHMTKYRKAPSVSKRNARAGDIVVFKWKKEKVYNHAAVVVGNNGRDLQLRQHGGVSKTTLSAAIARYRHKANYIERVVILRPKSRS